MGSCVKMSGACRARYLSRVHTGYAPVTGVVSLRPGTPVQQTVDLFSTPGYVYLSAAAIEDIERDHRRIRELERSGLYKAQEGRS